MSKKVFRWVAVAAAFALASSVSVGGAAAHVTVNPSEAKAGSYARLDFRVPNESDVASTIKIEVHFPEGQPLSSVRTMAVPGWTVDVTKQDLDEPLEVHGREVTQAVSTLSWTADSEKTGVQPGEFAEFAVSAGPIPDESQLIFKVIQTYSDGSESAWIDEPNDDGSEPDEPAPVLTIVPSDGDPHQDSAVEAGEESTESSNTGLILGVIGTGLGAVALVMAALALRKRSSAEAA